MFDHKNVYSFETFFFQLKALKKISYFLYLYDYFSFFLFLNGDRYSFNISKVNFLFEEDIFAFKSFFFSIDGVSGLER